MTSDGFTIPGYELQKPVGEGGMATVFLAVQQSLNRKVAIKIMRRSLADASAEKRFLLEGQTLARLPHPNIVGVFDIVQNDEVNYIAMEYLGGGTLSDRLKTGWLTLSDLIAIVVQIAGALQFAHDHGVVHRDMKPANILFRDARTPVLTDFGIARLHSEEATRITATGMMVGTPTYMSPEQATGGRVDGRADQYSLGVMFYEMMAKKPPFVGDTPMQVAMAHVSQPPPPLPIQFAFAQPLMDKMLAKKPEDRFPDLKAFTRELKNVLTGSKLLQSKLEINPAEDVSEQLKALGFAEAKSKVGVELALDADLPAGGLANQILAHSDLSLAPVEAPRRAPPPPPPPPLPLAKIATAVLGLIGAAVAAKMLFTYLNG